MYEISKSLLSNLSITQIYKFERSFLGHVWVSLRVVVSMKYDVWVWAVLTLCQYGKRTDTVSVSVYTACELFTYLKNMLCTFEIWAYPNRSNTGCAPWYWMVCGLHNIAGILRAFTLPSDAVGSALDYFIFFVLDFFLGYHGYWSFSSIS